MDDHQLSRNELLAKKVIIGLQKRNMTGYYAENKDQALQLALDLIPEGASIGWGGSVSVGQIGLRQAILNGNYRPIDRDSSQSPQERRAKELQCLDADFFLCSSNAVTEDGILVNMDGYANRVAAICYGPRHILMIVGMNKVVKDVDAAVCRTRNIAAPTNAQRFPVDTPCKRSGSCADCVSPDTICCQMLITRYSRQKDRIHVILVNDTLGY